MASLSVPYARGTVPTILLRLETTNGRKVVGGEIDSGSDRSLCPLGIAQDLGLQKITAQMTSDQKGARATFERIGFRPEALLTDHVIDQDDRTHDMLVMSYDVGGFQ